MLCVPFPPLHFLRALATRTYVSTACPISSTPRNATRCPLRPTQGPPTPTSTKQSVIKGWWLPPLGPRGKAPSQNISFLLLSSLAHVRLPTPSRAPSIHLDVAHASSAWMCGLGTASGPLYFTPFRSLLPYPLMYITPQGCVSGGQRRGQARKRSAATPTGTHTHTHTQSTPPRLKAHHG